MAAVSHHLVRPSRVAAVCTLKSLSVLVCDALVTPRELGLYAVDNCIVACAELLALDDDGEGTSENVAAVLSACKQLPTPYGVEEQS